MSQKMYTGKLFTLFLFLILKKSQCSQSAVDPELKILAESYSKWVLRTWTPDMFAFRGQASTPDTHRRTSYEDNSAEYASSFFENSTSQCSNDLLYTIDNLKSAWALKMFDAYGKLPSGLLGANVKWPGDYKECIQIYAPQAPNSTNGSFHGRYCTGSWTLTLGIIPLPLSVGMCVPDTCDAKELKENILQTILLIEKIPVLNKLAAIANITDVSCKPLKVELDGPAIGMICFLSILGILMAVGSSITVFEYFIPPEKEDFCGSKSPLNVEDHLEDSEPTNVSINQESAKDGALVEHNQNGAGGIYLDPKLEQKPYDNNITKHLKSVLKCFCVFTNGAKILNTDVGEGQLLCIHGIRFLSMAWVILGHTYAFGAMTSIANLGQAVEETNNWSFQVIYQGTLSVDSFFVLSGFLLTYLFLKEADKTDGKISWPFFYFHRYWRLTPVYMIALGFDVALTKYLGSGPLWPDDGFEVQCKNTWWRNLLYINNFGDSNQQCFGWAWYLANDMQFYIISPIFLYALWRWPKAGLSIVFTLLLSTWITSGVISAKYDLIATYGAIGDNEGIADLGNIMVRMGDFFWKMYVKPYTRIGPYLIGVFLGYIIYKTKNSNKFLEPWMQVLGWSIATAFPLAVIFGVYHAKLNTATAAAYNSLARSAFAIGLAWVIYACLTGHAVTVNKILSWKMFIPLSRLTYCAYLVHPIVMNGFYMSVLQPLYFTHLTEVILFFGFLILSYMVALIASLAMESPMMGVEKLLLRKS